MSVLIDLAEYLGEVEAFAALADDFVDKRSALRLTDVVRELKTGIDLGQPEWSWQTREDIVFRPSRLYDGPGRVHVDTWLRLGFKCDFYRPKSVKKATTIWAIVGSATHVTISKDNGNMPCHFDYKNNQQWGPQLHFQVSENLGNLPIPRIPSTAFLPTDCADLVLAELHHEAWRQLQAAGSSSRHVSVIREAQEHRTRAYVENIASFWRGDTKSTRVSMLQNYSATIAALPDRRGRSVARPW
ncbi:hypothetical protein X769_28270 [Mesorhizobium sp. LSJC268A00]|uniref:hypothetical protein n=1 Tax=unclassified Mesorhizobium TaxID=325217 RepID=UPI0003CF32E3|nr:hypothetical protein [Mesorhizobium sp. LSJC268A00]ESW95650.1 hypothetical protein X769_28270 [Mesorhizobium sp. LSJC268A00]